MLIKSFLKRVVPRSVVVMARTAPVALRLGLVFPWLMSLRNSRSKDRLGTEYGGWTIPRQRLTAESVCYCVGCGEDISFDLELIRRYSCIVHAFDPTPRSIEFVRKAAVGIPAYRFAGIGIWDRDGTVKFFTPRDSRHVSHSITNLQGTESYIEVPTRRLREILRQNGHRRLTLLKLDIEGAENTVIRTILEDRITVDILLVEFDELGFPTPERIAQIRDSVRALLRHGYELFDISHTNFTFILKQGQPRSGEPAYPLGAL
jgi:FkbM family methyltransferase